MPAVTVFSKPNGEPMASTHSPTLICAGSPSFTDGQALGVDLHHRDVGRLVGADHFALELAPVGEAHAHLVRAFDDVRVGEDHAVGVHDEARAHALARLLRQLRVPSGGRLAGQVLQPLRRAAPGFGAGRRDVDHRPLVRLGDRGEVGKRLDRSGSRRRGGCRRRGRCLGDGRICEMPTPVPMTAAASKARETTLAFMGLLLFGLPHRPRGRREFPETARSFCNELFYASSTRHKEKP